VIQNSGNYTFNKHDMTTIMESEIAIIR